MEDPFEKPLPTRDELPYWSMREVLPELLETEETAVRPRTIVRRAPRTARSGRSRHSRPERSRDRAGLGSATRDETTRAAPFPEHAPALPMKRGAGSAVHRKHVLTSYPSSIILQCILCDRRRMRARAHPPSVAKDALKDD